MKTERDMARMFEADAIKESIGIYSKLLMAGIAMIAVIASSLSKFIWDTGSTTMPENQYLWFFVAGGVSVIVVLVVVCWRLFIVIRRLIRKLRTL